MFNEPDASYHGLIYTEHFGAAAYIARCRGVYQRTMGAVLAPLSAFLLLQGIETVALRVERHVENARRVAEFLRQDRRVAWVGPKDSALADSFAEGVHALEPGTVILRAWSVDLPASCKESALGAIARGATVVMGPQGLCAAAAIDGAHERNQPGLQLSDFELPGVAAAQIVRDAVRGRYHGGEDVLFGAASGAVAIRHLDPLLSAVVGARARAAAEQLASGRPLSG